MLYGLEGEQTVVMTEFEGTKKERQMLDNVELTKCYNIYSFEFSLG